MAENTHRAIQIWWYSLLCPSSTFIFTSHKFHRFVQTECGYKLPPLTPKAMHAFLNTNHCLINYQLNSCWFETPFDTHLCIHDKVNFLNLNSEFKLNVFPLRLYNWNRGYPPLSPTATQLHKWGFKFFHECRLGFPPQSDIQLKPRNNKE